MSDKYLNDKYQIDFPIHIRCSECDYPLDCELDYSYKQISDERSGYFIKVEACKHCAEKVSE